MGEMHVCQNHDNVMVIAKEALDSAKSAHHRISKHEEQLDIMYKMSTNLEILCNEQKTMSNGLEKVVTKLEAHDVAILALNNRPAKTALALWKYLGGLIAAAIIGGLISAYIF